MSSVVKVEKGRVTFCWGSRKAAERCVGDRVADKVTTFIDLSTVTNASKIQMGNIFIHLFIFPLVTINIDLSLFISIRVYLHLSKYIHKDSQDTRELCLSTCYSFSYKSPLTSIQAYLHRSEFIYKDSPQIAIWAY